MALRIAQQDKTDTTGTSTDAEKASDPATAATATAATATAATAAGAAATATPSIGAPVSEEDLRDKSRAQPAEMMAQGASQVNHLTGKS